MTKRGFSLTELLVVMGMTSVVFSVAVGMVHRLMHEQKLAQRDNAMHQVAERLSTRLREDVHLADRAELVQIGDQREHRLVLNQPGQRIVTYTVRKNVMERAATREGEPTHHDSFPFPDNYRLEFSNNPAKQVAFMAFAIPQAYLATDSVRSQNAESDSDIRPVVIHVEAGVGRDHRFLSKTKEMIES